MEDTIAATAELYEPMRLKEVYNVHRPLLDQREKYQDVILQRVLGGKISARKTTTRPHGA